MNGRAVSSPTLFGCGSGNLVVPEPAPMTDRLSSRHIITRTGAFFATQLTGQALVSSGCCLPSAVTCLRAAALPGGLRRREGVRPVPARRRREAFTDARLLHRRPRSYNGLPAADPRCPPVPALLPDHRHHRPAPGRRRDSLIVGAALLGSSSTCAPRIRRGAQSNA